MNIIASSSSPPSSFRHNWKHHVFPSFHGADVRKAFLSHIMKEFRSKGIDPFIDNDIERSKSIGPELIEAIRGSRIAIVLLSKNYASSTWCMNELVEIIKCREELDQIVMTLFYEVDPTDVKKQTGHFGEVFKRTCKGKTKKVIKRWRHALAEVATIAGEHSSLWKNEADMIEKIVKDVSNKLNNSTPSRDFECLVGMETHMKKMRLLLRLDMDEVRMIGIWGPSGIGKTTIARFLFSQHSKDFQLSVFMENIKRTCTIPVCSDDYGSKLQLQQKFMSQITKEKDIQVPHLGIAKDRLKDKKVLVVLDDVDQLVQLDLIDCSSLVELPSSIWNATNLQELHLSGCSSLVELPSSIWNATNLQELHLSGCSSLVKLPSSIGNATNLQELHLSRCSNLVKLPSSIGNATNLQKLYLNGCSSLMELPSSIGNATNLQKLNLSGCSSLVKLPSSIGNATNLRELYLNECSSLVELPSSIGNATNLQKLNLSGCSSLVKLPSSIGNAIKLSHLSLSGCSNLVELPSSIGKLPDSLSFLDAENCVSLERLDCSFSNLVFVLNFRNCFKLNQEARYLIIQTSTRTYSILPGGEVPACFTYRASGSSVTVNLNEQPLCTSRKFKVCIVLVNKSEDERERLNVDWRMTSKQNALTSCGWNVINLTKMKDKEHLYIFEVEAEEVTSTELVFEFDVTSYRDPCPWKIKECGILQLWELQGDEDSESSDEEICDLTPRSAKRRRVG